MIDIGRAFKAPFDDKDWLSKTLLGLLWGLLIVTAPAVSGAQLAYIRSVSEGDERLPAWDDFGTKWVEGLAVMLAGFLYFLPVFVVFALLVVPVAATAVIGGNSDAGVMGGLFAGGFCIFWLAAVVYSIAVSVLFSAAMTNYAIKRTFGAFFDVSGIMGRVRGGTGYFTAWIYTLVIAIAGSIVASVLAYTVVGAVLSTGVTYLVAIMSGHVLGQWAARAYGVTPEPALRGPYPGDQPPAMPIAPVSHVPTPPAPPAPTLMASAGPPAAEPNIVETPEPEGPSQDGGTAEDAASPSEHTPAESPE